MLARSLLFVVMFVAVALTFVPVSGVYADTAPGQSIGPRVENAKARASIGPAMNGAAYLTITGGATDDTLIGAATPAAASASVHESRMDNDMMTMRAVPEMEIPAGKTVSFAPGGYHVMLMGLKQKLVAGESFPLTLRFAHAGPVTVQVQVYAVDAHERMRME